MKHSDGLSEKQTRSSKLVAHISTKSYRRETVLQGGLVMAKSGRLELGDNIYGHHRSIFNHCDVFGQQTIEFGEKRKIEAITPFKVIQGHRSW